MFVLPIKVQMLTIYCIFMGNNVVLSTKISQR